MGVLFFADASRPEVTSVTLCLFLDLLAKPESDLGRFGVDFALENGSKSLLSILKPFFWSTLPLPPGFHPIRPKVTQASAECRNWLRPDD
jgi:hypothetical protein